MTRPAFGHRCSSCGLVAAGIETEVAADRLESGAAEWLQILTSNPAANSRPHEAQWSPLEYGAHVRDRIELAHARLVLMLIEDQPHVTHWDQDEAAISGDYANLDADQVGAEITTVTETFVGRIRSLEESQRDRSATGPDGGHITVRALLQDVVHDVVHHLWDVTGQQEQ